MPQTLSGQQVVEDNSPNLVWITVHGIRFKVHKDYVKVATYIIDRWHREVEPLKNGQCWGYSYRPARQGGGRWSDHSGGFSLDLNSNGAGSMLWGASSLKATDAQLVAAGKIKTDINKMVGKDLVGWGGPKAHRGKNFPGDYGNPGSFDPMHYFIKAADASAACRLIESKLGGGIPSTPAPVTQAAAAAGKLSSIANLKFGATHADIKLMQEALKARGFDPGGVDGGYGEKTKAAVAAYQRSLGFSGADADGLIGNGSARKLGLIA